VADEWDGQPEHDVGPGPGSPWKMCVMDHGSSESGLFRVMGTSQSLSCNKQSQINFCRSTLGFSWMRLKLYMNRDQCK
jgi:hypothetical protein